MTAFEEAYKSVYTHGLESIYALENVDPSKIRRIAESPPIAPKPKKSIQKPLEAPLPSQLEFNFGDNYNKWIDSFVLDEPLQVLGLSRHAERCLNENGILCLRGLIGQNLREFVFFKGMGQGHIDEIHLKLKDYLEGHVLEKCPYIDFQAWMRVLIGSHNPKKTMVFLEPYELAHLITLSSVESIEVRRLTLEKRLEWREEMAREFTSNQKIDYVHGSMQKVVDVFIKGWLRQRMGFATKEELNERLQRVARNANDVEKVVRYFQELYFLEQFPIKHYMLHFEELFFVDATTLDCYRMVIDRALTYFYKQGICYALKEFTCLLEREFACQWEGFLNGFIEKCLKYTNHFIIKKYNNKLMVYKRNFSFLPI